MRGSCDWRLCESCNLLVVDHSLMHTYHPALVNQRQRQPIGLLFRIRCLRWCLRPNGSTEFLDSMIDLQ